MHFGQHSYHEIFIEASQKAGDSVFGGVHVCLPSVSEDDISWPKKPSRMTRQTCSETWAFSYFNISLWVSGITSREKSRSSRHLFDVGKISVNIVINPFPSHFHPHVY